jgi:hypothetical protein
VLRGGEGLLIVSHAAFYFLFSTSGLGEIYMLQTNKQQQKRDEHLRGRNGNGKDKWKDGPWKDGRMDEREGRGTKKTKKE